MASKFDIKLTPASQRLINRLKDAGKIDLRPTLNTIGTSYRKEVKIIFEKKQSRGEGMKWAPLSDNPEGKGYASWKAKHFPGRPILVRTGALKQSMITKGAEGNITAIGKTQAIFGTSIPYGIYHDSDKRRKSKLPRRNFSEPSERRMEIWKKQIEDDIRRNFESNGIKVEGAIFQ